MPGLRPTARTLLILAAVLLTPHAKSYAHCAETAPGLVWSYPADHDTDIPLDVSVQLLTSVPLAGNWRAELNGKELTTELVRQLRLERKIEDDGETQVYPLGDLDPETEYTFQLIPEDESTPQPHVAISFRTGVERAPAAIAPQVLGSKVTEGFPKMTARCVAVSIHNDCEERLGPVRSLQVESSHAVAWLVNRLNEHAELWPIECTPVSDALVANDASPCFQLRTVNARGEHSQVTQCCPQPVENGRDSAVPPPPDGASCSTTHVGTQQFTTGPSALFAVVALIAWRRRLAGRAKSTSSARMVRRPAHPASIRWCRRVGCDTGPVRQCANAARVAPLMAAASGYNQALCLTSTL